MGLFDWDLMATSANTNKTPERIPLPFFSRYFDANSAAVNVFSHVLDDIKAPFCFPPESVIFIVLSLLRVQNKSCVILVPKINVPWVNMLKQFAVQTLLVSKPFDNKAFTITHPTGKRVNCSIMP